jgi:hypothetical protein
VDKYARGKGEVVVPLYLQAIDVGAFFHRLRRKNLVVVAMRPPIDAFLP